MARVAVPFSSSESTSPFTTRPTFKPTYSLLNKLGQGTFGEVWVGHWTRANGEVLPSEVAIKLVPKPTGANRTFQKFSELRQITLNEKLIAETLQGHPNVLGLIDFADTADHWILVFDFAAGGDLLKFVRKQESHRLPADKVFSYFYQMVSALEYCHTKGVALRDIKLQNVLLDASHTHVWLADFGLATNRPSANDFVGTMQYSAPEVFYARIKPGWKPYSTAKADIWSLGVVLFQLCTSQSPYTGETFQVVYEKIQKPLPDISACVEPDAKDLIMRMLHQNPTTRISLADIKKHAWWKAHCAKYELDPIGVNASNALSRASSSGAMRPSSHQPPLCDADDLQRSLTLPVISRPASPLPTPLTTTQAVPILPPSAEDLRSKESLSPKSQTSSACSSPATSTSSLDCQAQGGSGLGPIVGNIGNPQSNIRKRSTSRVKHWALFSLAALWVPFCLRTFAPRLLEFIMFCAPLSSLYHFPCSIR